MPIYSVQEEFQDDYPGRDPAASDGLFLGAFTPDFDHHYIFPSANPTVSSRQEVCDEDRSKNIGQNRRGTRITEQSPTMENLGSGLGKSSAELSALDFATVCRVDRPLAANICPLF